MGYSVVDIDIETKVPHVVWAQTFKASQHYGTYAHLLPTLGDRGVRLYWHSLNFWSMLNYYQPDSVAAESPFLGRFAGAFESLVECRKMLIKVLQDYDPYLELELVSPISVKQSMGLLQFKGDTKGVIKDALLANNGLSWDADIDPMILDEHSVDAVSVGYYKYIEKFGDINVRYVQTVVKPNNSRRKRRRKNRKNN